MKKLPIYFLIGLLVASTIFFSLVYILKIKPASEFVDKPQELLVYKPNLPLNYLGDDEAQIFITVLQNPLCSSCDDFNQNIFPVINEEYIKTGKIKYFHVSNLKPDDIEGKTQNYLLSLQLLCTQNLDLAYNKVFTQKNYSLVDIDENCMKQAHEELVKQANKNDFFGNNIEPMIIINILGNDDTVIRGSPNLNRLRRLIREKEILLGMN